MTKEIRSDAAVIDRSQVPSRSAATRRRHPLLSRLACKLSHQPVCSSVSMAASRPVFTLFRSRVSMLSLRAALCLLPACFLLAALPAPAWNDTGHMTVAELAWRRLSAGERGAITVLLRQHPHHALLAANMPRSASDTNRWIFLRAATWPDMVRPSRDPSRPKPASITAFHHGDWHYTNAPYVAPADVGAVHPPAHGEGKILAAIAANEALLKDKTKPAPDRAVALCWLLHLYGDLHQPLHCVAWFSPEFPHGDRGGNSVLIRPLSAPVVLHSFWDDALGSGESPMFIDHTADTISNDPAHTNARLRKDLAHTSIRQWAEESVDAAEAFVYLEGRLKHIKAPVGGRSLAPSDEEMVPEALVREGGAEPSPMAAAALAASVPAVNAGYATTAETIARRRAALAGRRLGGLLRKLF